MPIQCYKSIIKLTPIYELIRSNIKDANIVVSLFECLQELLKIYFISLASLCCFYNLKNKLLELT